MPKWTEMYGLKMWLRNVRHPSRTGRLSYHILVLFIAVAWVCSCHGPTYENKRIAVKPSVRNNIFVKFQRLYLYFPGRPIRSIGNDHRKENKMAPVNRK